MCARLLIATEDGKQKLNFHCRNLKIEELGESKKNWKTYYEDIVNKIDLEFKKQGKYDKFNEKFRN